MKVTMEMIDAAMKKATEAGLLPRHARHEDVSINRELIRMVLTAALESKRNHAKASVPNTPGNPGGMGAAGTNGVRRSDLSKLTAGVF